MQVKFGRKLEMVLKDPEVEAKFVEWLRDSKERKDRVSRRLIFYTFYARYVHILAMHVLRLRIPMSRGRREVRLTRHAAERAYRFNLSPADVEKIIADGQRIAEGKRKARYVLNMKDSVFVAICEESDERVDVITITKGKGDGKRDG